MIKTIEYQGGLARMIDQTRLPWEKVFVDCRTIEEVGRAIQDLVIRGAPAIGVAAAIGVSLGANAIEANTFEAFYARLEHQCDALAKARPTAANLAWGIERMKRTARKHRHLPVAEIKERLRQEALAVVEEDIQINRKIGGHGQALLKEESVVLTHCNAGALATAGYGTALGVVRAAVEAGKRVNVLANETRPFFQGSRLTVWELMEDGIPVKLITDGMSGYFMMKQQVDAVVVGADRIAANGDVANKIGTYMVAALAHRHGIPFYVAAPVSTLDLTIASGEAIPIEEREGEEVVNVAGQSIAPEGTVAAYPAFDITPHALVTAIITENGIARPPFDESLKRLTETG
jgi:methylthioribose-1-phosphate isomerase